MTDDTVLTVQKKKKVTNCLLAKKKKLHLHSEKKTGPKLSVVHCVVCPWFDQAMLKASMGKGQTDKPSVL